MKDWLKLIRVHQWAKNLILFVPLVTSHRILELGPFLATVAAFFAFCFVASATYIFNDLMDLSYDRQHQSKRHRPMAAGRIGTQAGQALAAILAAAGLGTAVLLPRGFLICLGVYVVLSLLYSMRIKKIPLADVTLLAILYTIRILAGSYAGKIECSVWLLVFSIFFFFSLAMLKRYAELNQQELRNSKNLILGRGYTPGDLNVILAFGSASSLLSILVLMLYVNSNEIKALYERPNLLLLLAPIFIFWVCRIWLFASQRKISDDPVLFALKDRISYAVLMVNFAVLYLAT